MSQSSDEAVADEPVAIEPTRVCFRRIPWMTLRSCADSFGGSLLTLLAVALIPCIVVAAVRYFLPLTNWPVYSFKQYPVLTVASVLLKIFLFSLVPLWVVTPLGLVIMQGRGNLRGGLAAYLRLLPCLVPLMTVLGVVFLTSNWLAGYLQLPATPAGNAVRNFVSVLPMFLLLALVLSRYAIVPMLMIDRNAKILESFYWSEVCSNPSKYRAFVFFLVLHLLKFIVVPFYFDSLIFLDSLIILMTVTVYLQSTGQWKQMEKS